MAAVDIEVFEFKVIRDSLPLQRIHDRGCVCLPLPSALCAHHAKSARLNCTGMQSR